MKAIKFTLLCLLFSLAVHAQTDILQVPTENEKREVKKILRAYNNFTKILSDTGRSAEKKRESVKFFKETATSPNMNVYNDLGGSEDSFTAYQYIQKLSLLSGKYVIKTDTLNLSLDKVKYDKIRRYYFIEARTEKTFFIKQKIKRDTLPDSLATFSDTLISTRKEKLSFYIKFDKENNVLKNFKIFAISRPDVPPKLEPLPPLITWWMSLDEEWKSILRKRIKMDEYPRVFDIEKVTGVYDLNCVSAKISDLEPLRKFTNLEKLDCSHTAIKSLAPLAGLTNLKSLNASFCQLTSLQGLEKLSMLTELKCKVNKIEDLSPVKNLVNLMELDFSENELENISAVKDLTMLNKLDISLNIKIKSIAEVSGLINLEKLAIRKIDVGNLEPVRKLINLKYLDVYNTNITTLEPIRNIHKIFHLNIDHNKITSLEPIRNLVFIAELTMSSTSVTDLTDLTNFSFLREFECSDNPQIKSLGPVNKFENVKILKIIHTGISKEEAARFKKNHPNCQITYY
jgi:Leucine-rich repeat (LRR) protein